MTTPRDADVETGLGALLQRSSLSSMRWHIRLPKYADLSTSTTGLRHQGEHLLQAMCLPNNDTIHVPGVWLQAHHLENAYYEKYFRNGMTEAHELHDQRWHRSGSA